MIPLLLALWIGSVRLQPDQQQAPADPATAVIRGRVVSIDGRPLVGAHVSLARAENAGRKRNQSTDDGGTFEFTDLSAGAYRLTADKPGYATLEFGQKRAGERGEAIALGVGEARERIELMLPRNGAIVGHIVDENGDPVEGVLVSVLQIRSTGGVRRLLPASGVAPRRSNDQGRFRVYGLQPGDYFVSASVGSVLTASLPGYATTYFPGTASAVDAQLVRVGWSEDVPNVDFGLIPVKTATIKGQTLMSSGEPFQGGVQMRSSRRSGGGGSGAVGAKTYQDGRFEFPNVPPGEYVIEGFRNNERGWQIVNVGGVDVTGVVVQTMAGSTISGRIVFDGGSKADRRGFDLAAIPADPDLTPFTGGSAHAEVRDDFTFQIPGVIGLRRLRLYRAPIGWALKSILLDGQDVTDLPLPFGISDESIKDLEVVLTDQVASITGGVIDARGAPITDCAVIVFPASEERRYEGSRFFANTRPLRDGTLSIVGLAPESYLVAALDRLPGVEGEDGWQDPEFLARVAKEATSVTLSEGRPVSVALRVIGR